MKESVLNHYFTVGKLLCLLALIVWQFISADTELMLKACQGLHMVFFLVAAVVIEITGQGKMRNVILIAEGILFFLGVFLFPVSALFLGIFFLADLCVVCSLPPVYYLLPYVLVLLGGIVGLNVFIVLLIGILSGSVIALCVGQTAATELLARMGTGAAGMFETSMVAVLVAALCALIREYGGFDALLGLARRLIKGPKGGQLGIGLLVGVMDIATANNTVAIVMANPIAKELSSQYGIAPKRTACLLDTFSCIFQCMIPYGAQMLIAISVSAELGVRLSSFQIMQYLFYPYLLLISSLVAILMTKGSEKR